VKKIYFDLDGTLAEWKKASSMRELFENHYFLNLKEQKNILNFARSLAENACHEVYILSAFLPNCTALEDKTLWCVEKAPEIKNRIFIINGSNKADAVIKILHQEALTNDDILIDDYSKNLNEWTNAGGKAIKWLNGINGNGNTFKGPRTNDIRELYQLLA